MKKFCCSKQGEKDSNLLSTSLIRKSRNTRSSYKYHITFKLDHKYSMWKVHLFVEKHNHILVIPSKKRIITLDRHISTTSWDLVVLWTLRTYYPLNNTHTLRWFQVASPISLSCRAISTIIIKMLRLVLQRRMMIS